MLHLCTANIIVSSYVQCGAQESQQSLDISIKQQFKEILTYSNNHDIFWMGLRNKFKYESKCTRVHDKTETIKIWSRVRVL